MSALGMARLTREFIAAGGHLLISPMSKVEPRIDAGLIYGSGISDDVAQGRAVATRAILDAMRQPASEAFVIRAAHALGMSYNGRYILPREVQP